MTDRELLELTVKVAGIEVTAVVAEGIPHRFGGGYWTPITGDGDALRERLGVVMDEVCSKDSVNLFRGFVYV